MDSNEKELTTYGIVGGFRTGLITFMLALLTSAVIFLGNYILNDKERELQRQERLHREMIEYMRPAKEKMNAATDTVIKASTKAIASSEKMDSISNQLIQSKIVKP